MTKKILKLSALLIIMVITGCIGTTALYVDFTSGKEKINSLAPLFQSHDAGIEMVFVKGGCYQMGDLSDDYPEELPLHEVCVSDFYMAKYEITFGQWKSVMGDYPPAWKEDFAQWGKNRCDKDDCPVGNVSWQDTQEFIRRLNNRSGGTYRLPTEAEWEYACRDGGKKQKFCGGDDANAVSWNKVNSGFRSHPVGEKKPNGLGIYDMSGNQWEWTNDWYAGDYYSKSPRINPAGPDSGDSRTKRGGNVSGTIEDQRSSIRRAEQPDFKNAFLGFRLVRTP